MQDRPDLIQSELSGLAFDSLQQAFASADIERMFAQECPDVAYEQVPVLPRAGAGLRLLTLREQDVYMVIDPAAGGPQSDYAIVTFTRHKGLITVCARRLA